ncbi:hypothetical protein CCR85_02310 [Rhodothalassium salexigens]|uniref:Flagellar motor switch protein FliN n=1 Tax=Rhodothalassium salexigens DSM 2132 TaxID=1188247 RepID=A0A4R2PD03_RHOSA|nr:FliM/FliN family flagellar motor switch protein [Rhodothalassium salexigens]MBB4212148.1 flagellar motor switch protein FliN/FliY [Rhodothalassium salexigens DSM 2132]MBK1638184.1 hypothetical protein [Rhodothalassium salexigens DSM 2132]MBK5910322.1 hypothetical protein [Rhodothalassium salexigens]MBK5921065.1 hypothetical protein [Rhodothalassium salexigens]TCP33022.1 flagellar motor switch protein FliN/FliY [Rhodothalassium salexigens DSM 2132]
MSSLNKVGVEISVVIGSANMPIRQLLKMGRGAVVDLDSNVDEEAWIYANGELIARGEVQVMGEKIGVSITEMTSFRDL